MDNNIVCPIRFHATRCRADIAFANGMVATRQRPPGLCAQRE